MSSARIGPRNVNVLIVASSLWIGGAETMISSLARTIDRSRFNVTVCHLKHRGVLGDELSREGIDVVGVQEGHDFGVDYLTFIKLLRLIREKQIDVVHTHTTHGLIDSSLCKMFRPSLRLVHTFHFGNYSSTRNLPFSIRNIWMERVFSRFANKLIAVGHLQRQQIQTLYGLSNKQIGVVWNGVAIRKISCDPMFRRNVCAENCVLVGTIATMIEQKGLSDLLNVAKAVRDTGRNAVFVVVGEGHLRSELEAKRRELGLEKSVVFTGWVANAADVALPAFDIFFQPSLWEAMSMVILEAMIARKPIVATCVGENARVIEHRVDGLLVQPRDIDGMAQAIECLIDDVSLRVRLGEAARSKVERQFTVGHMARSYEAVYEELMR